MYLYTTDGESALSVELKCNALYKHTQGTLMIYNWYVYVTTLSAFFFCINIFLLSNWNRYEIVIRGLFAAWVVRWWLVSCRRNSNTRFCSLHEWWDDDWFRAGCCSWCGGGGGHSAPLCDSSQCRSIEVEVRARKNVLWQYKTVITGSLETMWT